MAGGVLQAAAMDQDGSYDSAVKPGTGDACIVSNTLDETLVTTDATGHLASVDLGLLQTHPASKAQVGTPASPIVGSADLLQHFGAGAFNFEATHGGAARDTERVEITAANPGVKVQLGSKSATKGDYVEIAANRGIVTLAANIAFDDDARVDVGSVTQSDDCNLTISPDAELLANLNVKDARVWAHNIVTNLVIAGGVVTKDTTKAVVVELLAGTLFYDHKAVGGDATRITVHRGAMLHLWNNPFLKTISTVVLKPGSIIVFHENSLLHNITTLKDEGAIRITSESEARRIAARRLAA